MGDDGRRHDRGACDVRAIAVQDRVLAGGPHTDGRYRISCSAHFLDLTVDRD
ncbi:hypothetical protein [Streptomyces sp. NPDC050355]|uniref:hypothetical protein n=1 Tax=Streptomyces sp. NPDC050355 TaxID=3365609 RepID=UPI0037986381